MFFVVKNSARDQCPFAEGFQKEFSGLRIHLQTNRKKRNLVEEEAVCSSDKRFVTVGSCANQALIQRKDNFLEVWGFFSSCGQLFADIINAVIVQTISGLKHGAVDKKEIIVKGEDAAKPDLLDLEGIVYILQYKKQFPSEFSNDLF